MRSSGARTTEASFLSGWECTLTFARRDSSNTSVTSLSTLFMIANGPKHPFLTPSFWRRSSSSARRRLTFPSSLRSDANSLVFTSVLDATVTRKSPCFLSLKKRFLVWHSLESVEEGVGEEFVHGGREGVRVGVVGEVEGGEAGEDGVAGIV
ncbi:hypothetical protein HJC23_009199 [Cyclotella cryptica]|uniref:Uncharacterized protein n=1 Tax=Cyclotella cryptica TaxID=29204 RepID=A0ABD3NU18_9STRA